MNNPKLINGLIVLGVGLLASSPASFLGDFPILGTATDFAQGFFDSLAVVAFCAAIIILARSRRQP